MKIGPYEVSREIGRGAAGAVFAARSGEGREVAVKLLSRPDPESFARFGRERRLLAEFGEAEGFVPLLDAGEVPRAEGLPRPYIVMPLVKGGTLRERLRRGPLPIEEARGLARALARALGRAHARGIVHRDVKPENVLFTEKGDPLVADLGLAKHFQEDAPGASASVSLSRSYALRGTAGYMAPEQAWDAKRAGPRADVFSLGAILYECLAGRPAFSGETLPELVARVEAGEFLPLRDLRPETPAWLEGVVVRALARNPLERFEDGAALERALEEVAASREESRLPRRRIVAVGAALALLAGAGVGLAFFSSSSSPSAPSARAVLERAEERLKTGDLEGATALADEALSLDRSLAPAWALIGDARERKKAHSEAIAAFTRAIELDPRLARAWAGRAAVRGAKGELEQALADSARAIELDPRLASGWWTHGSARENKGDHEGAIADLTRALELESRLALVWVNRGTARLNKKDLDGAIADATRALELEPENVGAWELRGQAHVDKGELDPAIADFTRAIELAPGLSLLRVNRGTARRRKKDLAGALEDFTRAIELAPLHAKPWANRGAVREEQDDLAGAIADTTRAIELDPRLAMPWMVRGSARERQGDNDGAISDWERFVEIAPDHPDAPTTRRNIAIVRKRTGR